LPPSSGSKNKPSNLLAESLGLYRKQDGRTRQLISTYWLSLTKQNEPTGERIRITMALKRATTLYLGGMAKQVVRM
jgi:hypothetical protein